MELKIVSMHTYCQQKVNVRPHEITNCGFRLSVSVPLKILSTTVRPIEVVYDSPVEVVDDRTVPPIWGIVP
jgi:hypothetical protein